MLPRELALSLGFREIGKVDNVSFFASGQSGLEEEFHWIDLGLIFGIVYNR